MAALTQAEVEKMIIGENESFARFVDYEIADIDLSYKVFEDPIDFRLARFVGSVNFTGTIFNERVDFRGAKFSNTVCFKDARFAKEVTFQTAEFPSDVINEIDFSSTQFEKLADFSKIKFERGINFYHAKFFEAAYFSDCVFKKSVHFEYVQFAQVYFNFSTFCGPTTFFDHSQFNGTTLFVDVQFCERVQFEGVRFLKDAVFKGKEGKTFFGDLGIYRYVKFNEEVVFRNINLEKVSFLNAAKLDKVHFMNVEWRPGARKTVYDEATIDDTAIDAKGKYRAVENIYQQLKINFESKGNYGYAGDFHYGEMEMRRLSFRSRICKKFSLTAFYKCLSGYGENPFRAFIVLTLFWIICAVLYFFGGIKVDTDKIINYDLTWNMTCVIGKKMACDFVYALFYSIQKSLLLRDLAASPSGPGSLGLGILQSILGPLQIALLGLAVKRRFKR